MSRSSILMPAVREARGLPSGNAAAAVGVGAIGTGAGAAHGLAASGVAAVAGPWAASALLHVAVMVVLAVGVRATFSAPPPRGMDLSFGEAFDSGSGEGIQLEPGLGGETSRGGAVQVGSLSVAGLLEREDFSSGVDAMLPHVEGEAAGSSTGDGSSGGDGEGSGNGNGAGDGQGDGKVAFFGTEGEGRRFVFLIDCSTSMSGERFSRARRELIGALLHLNEEQEFYIIFFSDRTFPLYAPHPVNEPVKATKLQKSKARRWISNRVVVGGTVPDEGLKMALAMKPDVLYFLSDGDFSASARVAASTANTNGTVIHTIAFGFQGGEAQLKAIAEDNKGRYRFVP